MGLREIFCGTKLVVNLSAIRRNYRTLHNLMPGTETGATIKANAYGMGARPIVTALWEEGCRNFFVSNVNEAVNLSKLFSPITEGSISTKNDPVQIFALRGIPNNPNDHKRNEAKISCILGANTFCATIVPVLSGNWIDTASTIYRTNATGKALPIMLDINSGMNRSGMFPLETTKDLQAIQLLPNLEQYFELQYLISHFANAEDPDHPKNKKQVKIMQDIKSRFPDLKISFTNSAGMYYLARNGLSHLCDLHRPGLALFGGNPTPGENNPMENAITLKASFYEKIIPVGDEFSYGGIGKRTSENQKFGTFEIGYNEWSPLEHLAYTGQETVLLTAPANDSNTYMPYIASPDPSKQWLKIMGKTSMGAAIMDITEMPNNGENPEAIFIGHQNPIDQVAQQLGIRPHSVLTKIKDDPNRVETIYVDPDNEPDPEIAAQQRLEIA